MPLVFYAQPRMWSVLSGGEQDAAACGRPRSGCPDSDSAAAAYAEAAACGCGRPGACGQWRCVHGGHHGGHHGVIMGWTDSPGAACALSPPSQPAIASCGPQTQSRSPSRAPPSTMPLVYYAKPDLWSVLSGGEQDAAACGRPRSGCPDSDSAAAACAEAAACGCGRPGACGQRRCGHPGACGQRRCVPDGAIMGRTGRPGAACSLSPVQQPAAASCGPQTQSLSLLRTPKHHAARFLHATALWSVLNAEHAQQAANANAAPTNATKSNHTPSLRARGGCCRPDSASSSAAAAAAAASAYAEAAACGCPGGTVMGTTGRTGATCALNLFKTVKSEGRSAFDLIEKEAAYQLVVNAPGLDARDIMIDLDDQVLTISGKKQPATEEAQQQQPQQQADKWEVVPSSSSIGEDEDEDGKVEDADDVSDTKTKTGHESPATSSAAATPTTSPRAATAPAAAAAAATAAASLTKSSDVRVLFSKRRQPSFVRALKLPGNVVAIGISASLECGVLTVTVPKTPEKPKPPPMRIKVQVAA